MCSENLILWNEQWKLLGGNAICRACGAVQQERDRGQPFVHAGKCKRAADPAQPWDVLDDAINDAQGSSPRPFATSHGLRAHEAQRPSVARW